MSEQSGGAERLSPRQRANDLVGIALDNLANRSPHDFQDGLVKTAQALIEGGLLSTLADVERCLREQPEDPMIFLLAVNKDFFGKDIAPSVIYPWDMENQPDFALCICMSAEEAGIVCEEQMLTYPENLRRLHFTGVPGGSYSATICAPR